MGAHKYDDPEENDIESYYLDRSYNIDQTPAPLNVEDNDDAGYKKDAGDEISRSYPIYPGEPIDDWNGRGNTGKLSSSDDEDWYFFAVCEGQEIDIEMTPPSGFNFDIGLWDDDENLEASSSNSGSSTESLTYTADYTGRFYFQILYVSGTDEGQYSFDVAINGQNDANTGNDAGGIYVRYQFKYRYSQPTQGIDSASDFPDGLPDDGYPQRQASAGGYKKRQAAADDSVYKFCHHPFHCLRLGSLLFPKPAIYGFRALAGSIIADKRHDHLLDGFCQGKHGSGDQHDRYWPYFGFYSHPFLCPDIDGSQS